MTRGGNSPTLKGMTRGGRGISSSGVSFLGRRVCYILLPFSSSVLKTGGQAIANDNRSRCYLIIGWPIIRYILCT